MHITTQPLLVAALCGPLFFSLAHAQEEDTLRERVKAQLGWEDVRYSECDSIAESPFVREDTADATDDGDSPQQWIRVLKALEVKPKAFIAPLNDLGFLLAESGNPADAIPILEAVIAEDAKRSPAYLNLADALWQLQRIDEACTRYARYRVLMKQGGKQAKMPARVSERCKH